jgi:WD40 repeat protein
MAKEPRTPIERRMVLGAFGRAIDRETHNLSRWPDLVWQQLYNRLQWEEEPAGLLGPERARRSAPGRSPWMRTRTPFEESRGLLRTLKGHAGPVLDCAVAPDASFLVSASSDGTLKLWVPSTGEELMTLKGFTYPSRSCAISPDGSFVVSESQEGIADLKFPILKLWDSTTGEELRTLRPGGGVGVTDSAVAPDGSLMVSGSVSFGVWDPSTGKELRTFKSETDLRGCAMAPDGSFLVLGSRGRNGILKIWDPATGEELRTLEGHTGEVRGCAVSPDGTFVVSASWDKTLKIWDPATGEELRTLKGHTDAVHGCAVSPDGSFLVSVSEDASVRVWDPATGEELRTLKGHTDAVYGCAVSPDGSFVVSASKDGTLKLWDHSEEELPTPQDTRQAASHGGSFVVSTSEEEGFRSWDVGMFKIGDGAELAPDGSLLAPDGSFAISGTKEGVKLLDPATGEALRTLEGHARPVEGCAVSPDGSFVVSASGDTRLKIWDPATGEELRTLGGHTGAVHGCAVSPDGSFVASVSEDATIRLWEPFTGKEIVSAPLIGALYWVDLHPTLPLAACGDLGRNRNLVDLVGIEYGPIIVTARGSGTEQLIRCPRCRGAHLVEEDRLGNEMRCPTEDCNLLLRVNSFLFGRAPIVLRAGEPSEYVFKLEGHWYEVEDPGHAGRDIWVCCRRCDESLEFNPGLGDRLPSRCPACHLTGSMD